MEAFKPQYRPIRLGTVHLLGWMLGCAVVLAALRLTSEIGDQSRMSDSDRFRMRLLQLGFGIAYGTAASGLGLFVWRWAKGDGPGPKQPGHWLLLFGGIALLIDLGIGAVVFYLAHLFYGMPNPMGDWRAHVWYQTIGYSIALALAVVTVFRLRDTSILWRVVAVMIAVMIGMNVAANVVSIIAISRGKWGFWPWHLQQYANSLLPVVVMPLIWVAEIADRRRGYERDWLHAGGIFSATSLACVALAAHVRVLWM